MQQRKFIGDAGRPFGTVAALLCLVLTVAVVVLWDVARDLAGTANPFHAVPEQARGYWGVLLAAEIVKCVTGGAILLAVWTLSGAIGPRSPRNLAATALGTIGALLIGVTAHWYIEAAAWLGIGRLSPMGAPMAALSSAALLCLGAWAVLLALEARRANSLPEWVQGAGLLLGAIAAVAAFVPQLTAAAALTSLVWWGGIFLTLYKPENRAARRR